MSRRGRAGRWSLLLFLLLLPVSLRGQEEPPGEGGAQPPFPSSAKSWAEIRAEARDYLPRQFEEFKDQLERLRIVRRPRTVVTSYETDPALWEAVIRFYEFIKGRELDVWGEQAGLPEFFPGRDAYYDFLDTMLPAMRDRAFERNRLLTYTIHAIRPVEGSLGEVEVQVSITSDDILPFKKTMLYWHRWSKIGLNWYPGKVYAAPATLWERLR